MTVKPKLNLAKTLTWRVLASLTSFIIGWVVTGNLDFGLAIGAADVIIKIALYYFHERVWYQLQFGVEKENNNRN
ncbi:DUF2061 domain-containing protein [uncultured Draconibacterium sp.]|uniref:DUF2061 domain-containing protein n=1 Tax=uncultured Draconibacterium sp. TaxID=1573823 RepID=UPI002AA8F44C|nr:DUF2061 domain-containing protein [uncultured Draconibacterium sp.]